MPNQIKIDFRMVLFVSNRGWKIIDPLSRVGCNPKVIVCTGSLTKRVQSYMRLIAFLMRHPGVDIVTDTPMWIGLMTWFAAFIMRRRYVIRLRGDTVREVILRKMPLHKDFFLKRLLPDSAGVIPVSNYLLSELRKQSRSIGRSKVKVIPTPQTSYCNFAKVNNRKPVLLVVTIFRLKSKVDRLFMMLPEIDDLLDRNVGVYVDILGDGPLLHRFKEEVYRLRNAKRIFLRGLVPDPKLHYLNARALLHVSDLDCYPSVVNEARAFGLPVIVSDTVGMSEQVCNGVDGILLGEQANALNNAWTILSKEEMWKRLSDSGIKRVEKENSFEYIGRVFVETISEMLDTGR